MGKSENEKMLFEMTPATTSNERNCLRAMNDAGEMIRKQTLQYNRSRQAMITKELIEIISGAEAL